MIDEEAADRLDGAPHPRERFQLIGHHKAEQTLLDAYRGGRMHHAWLIGGPEGIGKATLAYRFARFVLANPDPNRIQAATDLSVATDNPVAARIIAGAHPDLLALRRIAEAGKDKIPQDISVGAMRAIVRFFGSTAGEGGWRICLVDSADEMNRSSANALLKLLEEPPARSLFLIVSHMPGRLLPTIRSRCRSLTLQTLSEAQILEGLQSFETVKVPANEAAMIARHCEGSLRQALMLANGGQAEFADALDAALARLPETDPIMLHALGDKLARRDDALFELFVRSVNDHMHRRLVAEASLGARRLAPLSEVWEKVEGVSAQVKAFNLERKPFVFQVFGWLAEAGRRPT
ncbi:DNA polymerase III subunit delta' [Phreatobacter aquaticus]|uniref:DNA polymerase III subunit delta n=1 Tax=Phreatobacter aquaticus TaxID=2570229 RepID=A0A4D7QPF4_9HYPH|nr:DNA polymerase III subunit delta' [Phreatobacter aquaticus]QCK87466.1 DNA polymerase III subunit delta' [Phreatobacter aquaticus]